jgi:hypothetical protein
MDFLDHSALPIKQEYSSRRRISLSQTASGKLTWDITVELYNEDNKKVVKEARQLKRLLQKALKGEVQ